ncbi:elongation factor-like GTPase 1 [Tubulanus polymorphus]|uniref:elongation factor-like GTPase 1 n=1 Tax=Tubulanus polymorphus TaxID=672921 RepID=UPI003DA56C52
MPSATPQQLAQIQARPENIRNLCILAHVDHGKTTLADTLVASNGIISHRLAGKLRYLDSREDEQIRGITMKSSAISLIYTEDDQPYLINLIDSPGHVDFSSEVSTAVRLCDGAIVLVDVVEGVCPQTHVVLRQAWLENIKPVLVLNKIDRLINELKMTPQEAYLHLQQVLEQVNAVTGELFASHVFAKSAAEASETNGSSSQIGVTPDAEQIYDWSVGLEETDDSHLYFSPDQGNVVFACAYDGWGFGIEHFAELYASKLGIKSAVLRQTLWGDFYLNMKSKRIMKGAQAKGKKPLFVQFVLDNLWAVYDAVNNQDKEKVEKIVKSLNLKIPARDLKFTDVRTCVQAICRPWLPLSNAILSMVIRKLPSPLEIVGDRVDKLLSSRGRSLQSLPPETQKLKQNFLDCDASTEAPVIVFVSKMVAVERKMLPDKRQRPLTREELEQRRELARQRHHDRANKHTAEQQQHKTGIDNHEIRAVEESTDLPVMNKDCEAEDDHVFIAFARVFSGTIRKGQTLYVLGPKHDPATAIEEMQLRDGCLESKLSLDDLSSHRHITQFTVDNLYLMMGRELEALDSVPAGNVLGISGLENHVLKSATLSSTVACPAFTSMYFEAEPIVRVAVEPKQAGDLNQLMYGMKLLNQADPCVEILHTETGEHVIIAAGEVHLQRCLDDLQHRYAQIEINVSQAIVPFRETVVKPPKVDMVNEEIGIQGSGHNDKNYADDEEVIERGLVEIKTSNKSCAFRIRCLALPPGVTALIDAHGDLIKTVDHYIRLKEKGKLKSSFRLSEDILKNARELREKLDAEFKSSGSKWKHACDQIWSFGPRRCGPNILLNRIAGYERLSIWSCLETGGGDDRSDKREFDGCVVGGFQLASLAGPMCEEPMMGVCFVVECWDVNGDTDITTSTSADAAATDAHAVDSESHDGDPDELVSDISSLNLKDGLRRRRRSSSRRLDSISSFNDDSSSTSSDDDEAGGSNKDGADGGVRQNVYGPLSGQIMSCIRYGCRKAFETQHQRLMAAMYKCSIQATADVLGKLYAVLGKRNGKVLHEDMKEGSNLFEIEAILPVVESFGFTEEFRKKTSGLASPQLKFSHWEMIDIDPYWVPTTEEEIMLYGEKADYENHGRRYMNSVRKRKGLKIDEQIVVHAEKQRTLTRNK